MRKSALCCVWLGLVVMVLVALGLVVLFSASEANAVRLHGAPRVFIYNQFKYLGAGLVAAAIAAAIDYRKWRDCEYLTWGGAIIVLVMLCGVFAFRAVNGSHRWLMFGSVRVQPSELAKLLTVMVLSLWLDKKSGWRVELFWRGAFWPAVIIGIIALPVVLEPDFGSTMVIGLVGGLLMVVAGTRLMHMAPFFICGALAVVTMIALNPNRMSRLFDDKKQYQVNMALAAISNSEIWGAGLGNSMQKHLYLPEAHTDFVFAIGAEELGIVFSIAVVLLFVAFFLLSVAIARNAADRFGRFIVVGMSFIIFFQAMFNIGVVCKALPTKGMALPFFSYGGTNYICSFIAVGMILSVGVHSLRDRKRELMRKVVLN